MVIGLVYFYLFLWACDTNHSRVCSAQPDVARDRRGLDPGACVPAGLHDVGLLRPVPAREAGAASAKEEATTARFISDLR